jgi:hypothetical protein
VHGDSLLVSSKLMYQSLERWLVGEKNSTFFVLLLFLQLQEADKPNWFACMLALGISAGIKNQVHVKIAFGHIMEQVIWPRVPNLNRRANTHEMGSEF